MHWRMNRKYDRGSGVRRMRSQAPQMSIRARACTSSCISSKPSILACSRQSRIALRTMRAMLAGYFMIGIELIAEEVEEPFGRSTDDLMLDDICQAIEASVTEIL